MTKDDPIARTGFLRGALSRLRHPWLFGIAATALIVDLFVPDVVPFVDEILLAAGTATLGLLKKRRQEKRTEAETAAEPEGPTSEP